MERSDFAFIVLMYAMLAVLLVAIVVMGVYLYRRVRVGSPEERFDQLARRTDSRYATGLVRAMWCLRR